MATELITDPNCKHSWRKRECRHPLNNSLLASWETCDKCGSEKLRRTYR